MKKVKLFFISTVVLTIVGIAVAFKALKSNRDLLFCSLGNTCTLQPPGYNFSTIGSIPVTPPVILYRGWVGAPCGSINCVQFTGQVYINE
jgi:hypothetical protein